MPNKIDLNLYSVFSQVYHHQSITLAAEQLGVTQAAVSGSIKRLSLICGHDLFIRHGRGIIATLYAHQLMEQLQPSLEVLEGLVEDTKEFDSKRSKRQFTVLAFESITDQLLPHTLHLQTLGNPLITFKDQNTNETQINEALFSQQADLAIDITDSRDNTLIYQPLATDKIVLICRHNHPRINGNVNAEQFFSEQHIKLNLTRANTSIVDFYAENNLSTRKVVAECNSLLSLISLVAQSDCIGACSKSLAHKYQQAFNIQIIDMPVNIKPVQLSLIWHRRQRNNPAHKWLRDTISEIYQNHIGLSQ
ncbi:LysR family transcriptional regulator [Shewanella subflava]|uniref:LysR family transcriptional regulator n=1 Tax=Shewanella subflava TaxID=2986476 RepID=A0ABT3I7V2_9GAMM|nr:LysR family transcriptional regulator [Shewanella subflava]MCW3172140.1 LysR family transcriptional regulator [Shewanella subflava]